VENPQGGFIIATITIDGQLDETQRQRFECIAISGLVKRCAPKVRDIIAELGSYEGIILHNS
jgi:hypothetical protein